MTTVYNLDDSISFSNEFIDNNIEVIIFDSVIDCPAKISLSKLDLIKIKTHIEELLKD